MYKEPQSDNVPSAPITTFYNKAMLANPYATTNLIQGGMSNADSAFRPIQQQTYLLQTDGIGPGGSIDSGVKHDISSTDSNNPGELPLWLVLLLTQVELLLKIDHLSL